MENEKAKQWKENERQFLNADAVKKYFLLSLLWSVAIFSSCTKKDSTVGSTSQYNATIRVTVLQAFMNNGFSDDSLLPGIKVQVYADKTSRDLALPPDFSSTTNASGLAEFDNLDKSYYYLLLIHPNTNATIQDETNTPDKTISLLEEIFL